MLSLPQVAWAQDAVQPKDQGGEDAEIVVTGSHIKTDNFNSSSPLQVLGAEKLARGGDTNVAEFLGRIP